MRFSSYLLLLYFCSLTAFAQAQQRSKEAITFERGQETVSYTGAIPTLGEGPFFSYFLEWAEGPLEAAIRFSSNGSNWSNWNHLSRDEHNLDKAITHLQFGDPTYTLYELRLDSRQAQTQSATLHFYQPGHSSAPDANAGPNLPADPLACPCPQPEIQVREQWCPDGTCPVDATPAATTVTHLIVHHSAGGNSSNDWAATVRAIWDFHVNGNGWDDIGYNYLVDPNGVIYEGRGNDVRGAHFCGTNTATMGTCMLGTFSTITPTEIAINSLEYLLAWKSCDIDADPLGQSLHAPSSAVLNHISGHRDGCNTECPGDAFYPLFPGIRQGVQNKILAECSGLATPISLSATEVSETSYFLNWAHNSPEEEGFLLERSQGLEDNYELRAALDANTLSFFEEELELEQLYKYRIRAYNAIDTSTFSNVVTINTGLVNLHPVNLATSSLQLSPNPFIDQLQLDFISPEKGMLHYQLLDLNQRIIQEFQSYKNTDQWKEQLNMQHLSAGAYLIRIQLNGRQGVWKVVKQ